MLRSILFTLLSLILTLNLYGQETTEVWRINAVNPGAEYELPISPSATVSINLGVGYNGSYPNLTQSTFGSGVLYAIAPFADLQMKRYYNLQKRARHDKTTDQNSGNFLSIRFRMRGPSIEDNFVRKASYDFAIGPTWGIQRSYGRVHLLMDVGPQFYFDSKGNTGFWPLMPQINVGFHF